MTRTRSIPCALLLLAVAAPAEIIDRIAVSVGSRVITTSELDREIRVSAFLNGTKPDFSPEGKRAAAERMVDQKLIRGEMENTRYPAPQPSQIEPLLAQFRQERFKTAAEYSAALAEAGITEQDLRDALLWQRALLLFLDVRFRPGVQVGAQEIQDYFDKVVKSAARASSPGAEVNLDDYRDQIERTLAGKMVDDETARWLKDARRRTEIVYHSEALQ